MSPVIDFSQATTLEPISGEREATLTEHTVQPAKSGQPSAKFVFTLTDPEVEGRKIFASKSLQPQALWAVKEWYIALGADPDALAGPVDIEELGNALVGNECRLVLSVGQYTDAQGVTKPSQQVDKVLSSLDF